MHPSALRQRARTALAVLGAAALLVGGVNVATHAAGAADALVIGKKNTAEKSTTLKNKGKGPALKLKAKKGPTLSVNTKDLVKNLNAEMVGGSTSEQLEPRPIVHTLFARGAAIAQGSTFRGFPLPAGTYLVNLSFAVETINSDWYVGCVAGDSTVFESGDNTKVYVGAGMSDSTTSTFADSTRIVTVPAGSTLVYGCNMDTADTDPIPFPIPPTLTVRRLSAPVAGSSTPFSVSIRQARELVGR